MSDLAAEQMAVDLAILTRLAEADLAIAERMCAAVLAEPDGPKAERMARTYHRVSRAVRQTIWLKQRILGGRVAPIAASIGAPARPAPAAAPMAAVPSGAPSPPVAAHAAQHLRAAELGEGVGRVILAHMTRERERLDGFDAERPESLEALDFDERFEPLWDALEEEMGRRAARGGSTASLDDDVAEMCATLKLPGDLAAGWRTLPALGDPAKMYAEAEAAERADTS